MDVAPIFRGLRLRCPACGVGRMSPTRASFGTLADECPHCGTTFEPSRGEWSGALMFAQGARRVAGFVTGDSSAPRRTPPPVAHAAFVAGAYGALALLGMFAMLLTNAPMAWIIAWIALTTIALPILTYRNFKGAWIGLMWASHPWGAAS